MVRNQHPDEPVERTCGTATPPADLRARRMSLAIDNLDIEKANATREVIARANADFERIFGSDD